MQTTASQRSTSFFDRIDNLKTSSNGSPLYHRLINNQKHLMLEEILFKFNKVTERNKTPWMRDRESVREGE